MHSCNRLSFLSAGKERSDIFSVRRTRAHIQPVSVASFVKLLHFMDCRVSNLRRKTGVERQCPLPDFFTNAKLSSDDSWWALCSIYYARHRDCLHAYNQSPVLRDWPIALGQQTEYKCMLLIPKSYPFPAHFAFIWTFIRPSSNSLTSYFFTWQGSFSLWKACWGKSKIDVNGTISSWTLHGGHFDKLLAASLVLSRPFWQNHTQPWNTQMLDAYCCPLKDLLTICSFLWFVIHLNTPCVSVGHARNDGSTVSKKATRAHSISRRPG